MIKLNKIPIFPIMVYEIDVPQEIYLPLLQWAPSLDYHWGDANARKFTDVFGQPEAEPVCDWINETIVEIYSDVFTNPFAYQMEVSAMWMNKAERGDYTHEHIHPWSVISGIIYLAGSGGRTVFSRKNPYDNIMGMPISDRFMNREAYTPMPGKMILFPSNLEHSVEINDEDTTRYTLSFNTFPGVVNKDPTVHLDKCPYQPKPRP